MSNALFFSILLFEISFLIFAIMWDKEITWFINHVMIFMHFLLMCILWLMHFGSEGFIFLYHHPNDEDGEYREIRLPAIKK